MTAHTPTTSTVGDNLHMRAEVLLGKKDYRRSEYLDALYRLLPSWCELSHPGIVRRRRDGWQVPPDGWFDARCTD